MPVQEIETWPAHLVDEWQGYFRIQEKRRKDK
jgi:hypothetical protein